MEFYAQRIAYLILTYQTSDATLPAETPESFLVAPSVYGGPRWIHSPLINALNLHQPYVSSFPGTSQYTMNAPSACGVASLNAMREILLLEQSGCTAIDLLLHLDSRNFHQVSLNHKTSLPRVENICRMSWESAPTWIVPSIWMLTIFDNFPCLISHSLSFRSITGDAVKIYSSPLYGQCCTMSTC